MERAAFQSTELSAERGAPQPAPAASMEYAGRRKPARRRKWPFVVMGTGLLLVILLFMKSYAGGDGFFASLRPVDIRMISNRGCVTVQLWQYNGRMSTEAISRLNVVDPQENFSFSWRNLGFQATHVEMGIDVLGYWTVSFPYWILMASLGVGAWSTRPRRAA